MTSDAGLLELKTLSIKGDYQKIENFIAQKFYFIADSSNAYLVEGGLSKVKKGDIVTITKSGDLIIIREDEVVISRPIFFRDSDIFWDMFNFDFLNLHTQ